MKFNKKTLVLSSLLIVLVSLTACGGQEQPAPSTPAKTETPASEPAKTEADTAEATDTAESAAAEPAATQETSQDSDTESSTEPAANEQSKAADAAAKTDEPTLAADAGQKRYETTCKICHDTGMLDAPKMNDKANWEARAKKGKETLYTHSAKGFNKMPPQAIGDISEAEIKAAVDYMLEKAGVS